jgi:hypothetical protein
LLRLDWAVLVLKKRLKNSVGTDMEAAAVKQEDEERKRDLMSWLAVPLDEWLPLRLGEN